MTLKSIKKLRESLKDCTSEAGVESNRFDTYWITAIACDMLIDEIEREIAERYMELPVDRDGVPIHVGDYLQLGDTRGKVVALNYCLSNGTLPWEWQCDTGDWYNTAFACHYNPRTVEDVICDMIHEYACSDMTTEQTAEKYAAELRELMEVGE